MHGVDPGVMALREKYREIKRLRDAAAAGSEADPRASMVALARRFPGALRELDELPMSVIAHRLALLETLMSSADPVPEWVQLQSAYHGWMRVALRVKRMARGAACDRLQAIADELARSYAPHHDEPALASLDRPTIRAILKPDGGRLNPWVYRRVAAQFGVEPAQVERALFMEKRRDR